jgi:hypothetical protein
MDGRAFAVQGQELIENGGKPSISDLDTGNQAAENLAVKINNTIFFFKSDARTRSIGHRAAGLKVENRGAQRSPERSTWSMPASLKPK